MYVYRYIDTGAFFGYFHIGPLEKRRHADNRTGKNLQQINTKAQRLYRPFFSVLIVRTYTMCCMFLYICPTLCCYFILFYFLFLKCILYSFSQCHVSTLYQLNAIENTDMHATPLTCKAKENKKKSNHNHTHAYIPSRKKKTPDKIYISATKQRGALFISIQ